MTCWPNAPSTGTRGAAPAGRGRGGRLSAAGAHLLETLSVVLEQSSSLEGAARCSRAPEHGALSATPGGRHHRPRRHGRAGVVRAAGRADAGPPRGCDPPATSHPSVTPATDVPEPVSPHARLGPGAGLTQNRPHSAVGTASRGGASAAFNRVPFVGFLQGLLENLVSPGNAVDWRGSGIVEGCSRTRRSRSGRPDARLPRSMARARGCSRPPGVVVGRHRSRPGTLRHGGRCRTRSAIPRSLSPCSSLPDCWAPSALFPHPRTVSPWSARLPGTVWGS